jgi:hypothetical protein
MAYIAFDIGHSFPAVCAGLNKILLCCNQMRGSECALTAAVVIAAICCELTALELTATLNTVVMFVAGTPAAQRKALTARRQDIAVAGLASAPHCIM